MLTSTQRTNKPDLWAALPGELAAALWPEMHSLSAEILEEIQRQIPEYARPLDQNYVHAIGRGVEEGLGQFVNQIANPGAPQERCAEVHRALGKAEMQEGRSLDSLQAAYRLGARIAWRRISRVGERFRIAPDALMLLGEAIFAHIDELAALAVEGYAEAQAQAAGTLARRRRRLLELLLSDPQAPQRTLDEAAAAARWQLPSRITVVALERCGDAEPALSPLSSHQALVDLECAEPHLLIASDDVPESLDWGAKLEGWRVAVGPSVDLHEAPCSLRWARRMLDVNRNGRLSPERVTHCAQHMSSILMLSDENLALELIKQRLEPLGQLKPKQQLRLGSTLLAWLQTREGAPEVAQRLRVHPQTVRYRLHQLEELFGDALGDPDARFDLELALRAGVLLVSPPAQELDPS